MGDTRVPSLIVIGTAINQLDTKVSLKTICCLRLLVVVYKHLHTAVFIKAVRYICIETFVHKSSILFELYGHMYCYYNVLPEAIFVVYW